MSVETSSVTFDINIKDIKHIYYNGISVKSILNKTSPILITNNLFKSNEICNLSILTKLDNNVYIPLNNYIKLYNKTYKALIVIIERNKELYIDKIVESFNKISKNSKYNLLKANYTIIFIHQNNNFILNKGKLYNIAVYLAIKENIKFDYIIFHDIEIWINENSLNIFNYYYTNGFTLFKGNIINYKEEKYKYTANGCINIINLKNFLFVNGYSNNYECLKCSDDNFIYRCKYKGIPIYDRHGDFYTETNNINTDNNTDYKSADNYKKVDFNDGYNKIKNTFKCYIKQNKNNIYNFYVDFTTKIKEIRYIPELKEKLIIGFINDGHLHKDYIIKYFHDKNILFCNNLQSCNVIVGSSNEVQNICEFKYNVFKIFISSNKNYKVNDFYNLTIVL